MPPVEVGYSLQPNHADIKAPMRLHEIVDRFQQRTDLALHDELHRPISSERAKLEFDKISRHIAKLSRSATTPVVLDLPKGYKAILTMIACYKHRLTYSPMLPSWPESRKQQILAALDQPPVIDETSYDEIQAAPALDPAVPEPLKGHTVAYIIFTSGTTGEPKGVMISREALANFFSWVGTYFTFVTATDQQLLTADLTFDQSVLDIALFLTRGTSLKFSNFRGNPFRLAQELDEQRITILNTVPNNINLLGSAGMDKRCDLSRLRVMMIGGARFSQSTYRFARDAFTGKPRLFNFYGPTETTVYSHVMEILFDRATSSVPETIPVGKEIDGVCSCIQEGTGVLTRAVNRPGEILIGGIQVMDGYVRDSHRTDAAIAVFDGVRYYRTGDLGYFDANENLVVTGRVDETLKRRGYRVNLLDIDSYIQRIAGVLDSATIAVPDEALENRLVTFIIASDPTLTSRLDQKLREILLDYQIPDEIRFVTQFPTNSSGKVSRRLLTESYLAADAQ